MDINNNINYSTSIKNDTADTSTTQRNLSRILEELKQKYKINLIFDIANLLLSVISCILYILSTYYACSYHKSPSYLLFNFLTRCYFLIDFAFNWLTSGKAKMKMQDYMYIFVEIVTIFPYILLRLIVKFEEDYSNPYFIFSNSLISLRIFRIEYLSKYIYNEVNKKLYTIISSILSLIIFSSSIIQVLENTSTVGNYAFFFLQDCEYSCDSPNQSFFISFYFVMTTISTIGYYSDIKSTAGRVFIIGLIITSIIEIPNKCSELMMLLASKSVFSRISYKRLDKIKYILITGNISYFSMVDLLDEYFHPDHGEAERHALILLPHTPDVNMKYLLQKYINKLFYFEGDPLKEVDLNRCQFRYASTILILCNKQTDDSTAEDSKTILQAMAIRKLFNTNENNNPTVHSTLGPTSVQSSTTNLFNINNNQASNLMIYQNKDVKETKMLIQLLRPESELHFSLSISRNKNIDQILCIDELKLSLLAKSCLCQGIIALISNLITTSNTYTNEGFLENHKWMEEYSKGMSYEIYKVSLEAFRGEKFNELVCKIYKEKDVILFGINIEDKNDGHSLVLLNPSDFCLPYANDINVYGYLFAEDKTMADDILQWGNMRKSKKNKTKTEIDLERRRKTMKSMLEKLPDNEKDNNKSNDERDIKDFYVSSDVISISYICHITNEAIDKASIICDTIENKLVALEHIIICGICQNFIDFVKPLRAKYLPKSKCPTIVILCKDIPDDKLWSTIAFFEQIYIVQGDPMKKQDLQRSGIKCAKKVVILSPTLDEIFENNSTSNSFSSRLKTNDKAKKQARKLTNEEEDLLDSKTIFKYNMISKLKKDIFIVVELINPKNVSFLYNKGRVQNDEYLFIKNNMKIDSTASYASGEVYFSSIMDNLLVQAYYNESLLSVLKKIIVGEDQSIYKKAPLNRYNQIVSSNIYLINNPFDCEEKVREYLNLNEYFSSNKFGQVLNTNNNKDKTTTINLMSQQYNTNTERELVFNTTKKIMFKEIFRFFIQKGILVIGIYRSIDSSGSYSKNHQNIYFDRNYSNFYFVYTSPDKNDLVDYKDKLFVLSQVYPPDNILEGFLPIDIKSTVQDHNPFNFIATNLKKFEDKKDPKVESLDKTGLRKVKEVTGLLKDVQNGIDSLSEKVLDIHRNIEGMISKQVKLKINSLLGVHIREKIDEEGEEIQEENSENSKVSSKNNNNNKHKAKDEDNSKSKSEASDKSKSEKSNSKGGNNTNKLETNENLLTLKDNKTSSKNSLENPRLKQMKTMNFNSQLNQLQKKNSILKPIVGYDRQNTKVHEEFREMKDLKKKLSFYNSNENDFAFNSKFEVMKQSESKKSIKSGSKSQGSTNKANNNNNDELQVSSRKNSFHDNTNNNNNTSTSNNNKIEKKLTIRDDGITPNLKHPQQKLDTIIEKSHVLEHISNELLPDLKMNKSGVFKFSESDISKNKSKELGEKMNETRDKEIKDSKNSIIKEENNKKAFDANENKSFDSSFSEEKQIQKEGVVSKESNNMTSLLAKHFSDKEAKLQGSNFSKNSKKSNHKDSQKSKHIDISISNNSSLDDGIRNNYRMSKKDVIEDQTFNTFAAKEKQVKVKNQEDKGIDE